MHTSMIGTTLPIWIIFTYLATLFLGILLFFLTLFYFTMDCIPIGITTCIF